MNVPSPRKLQSRSSSPLVIGHPFCLARTLLPSGHSPFQAPGLWPCPQRLQLVRQPRVPLTFCQPFCRTPNQRTCGTKSGYVLCQRQQYAAGGRPVPLLPHHKCVTPTRPEKNLVSCTISFKLFLGPLQTPATLSYIFLGPHLLLWNFFLPSTTLNTLCLRLSFSLK